MTEPWSSIQADHDRIWDLLNALTGGGREPVRDPAERGRIRDTLVDLLRVHEAAEEKVIWPAVAEHCADGYELFRRGQEQEQNARHAVRELSKLTPDTAEFTDCANTIAGMTRQHVSYEQAQVWPRLVDALSPEALEQLARDWRAARA